ncbi:C-C chemokine receptor type 6 [Sorex araneus]|uniref:C-C chemokine receptor type 6 n=1 Tax=Sorex araneus TaxID=42254 RepID=UPI002433FCC3|nr:C-C chemokine receptor type 6 [Sorex araneus]
MGKAGLSWSSLSTPPAAMIEEVMRVDGPLGGNGNSTAYDYGEEEYDNESELCQLQEVRNFSRQFLPSVYALLCVSGLLGNALVVLTFALYKKAKSMTDVYLLNLAVADLLLLLTLPFWAVLHARERWDFGNAMCKLVRGLYTVNFHCGMLLLALVSLDRYVAIVQAPRSLRLRSQMLAHRRAICLAVWLLSVALSGYAFAFFESYPLQGREVCEPRFLGVREPMRWKLGLLGLQLLVGFFLPLCCMSFCYAFILRTLLQAQNAQRHKAVRVVAAVVLVFLACQIPYNTVLLVKAAQLGQVGRSCRGEKLLAYAATVTEALAFVRCCLNPVLYAFVGQRFRSYFLKLLKDLRGARGAAAGRACSRHVSDTMDDNASSFTM